MAKLDPSAEQDFKKELTSDFNEAKYQIYRLHYLYTKCHNYSERGDLIKLKWVLDRIWIELVADAVARADKKESLRESKYFKEVEKLNQKIAEVGTDRAKLYAALNEKEMFLRVLQDEAGKGSKRSDKDEEEFD